MPKIDCSELSAVITELAMDIGQRPGMDSLDKIVGELRLHVPEITRQQLVDSIVEATTVHREALDQTRAQIASLKKEAKDDVRVRRRIQELERHLGEKTLPETKARPDRAPETIKALRDIRDGLQKQVNKSEPAQRKRLLQQIDKLREQLEATEHVPVVVAEEQQVSKEVERLRYERDRVREQIREKIDALRPRKFWTKAYEPANLARSVMTSLDYSAVLRQGAFIALGHPVRAARALPAMFQAGFSRRQAQEINREILDRPNAPLYARSGLFLAPLDGGLSKKEEAYMSRWADKIPLVAGSQRAYVTFLNKLRADSFDAMIETMSRRRGPTLVESQATARYINFATGRGDLGIAEPASEALATAFFAPRLVVSRFQLLAGVPMYGGTMRTRMMIAGEYARFLAGIGVVYGLAAMAGADLEDDPRSTDFGKIRFGNTRIDPMAGLAQALVVSTRIIGGETKRLDGTIAPLRGEGVRYGMSDTADVAWRFVRTKFSPVMGTAWNIASGRNVVGEEVTPGGELVRMFVPLSYRDIAEAMEEHGVPKGTVLGLMSIFGWGVSTYESGK